MDKHTFSTMCIICFFCFFVLLLGMPYPPGLIQTHTFCLNCCVIVKCFNCNRDQVFVNL